MEASLDLFSIFLVRSWSSSSALSAKVGSGWPPRSPRVTSSCAPRSRRVCRCSRRSTRPTSGCCSTRRSSSCSSCASPGGARATRGGPRKSRQITQVAVYSWRLRVVAARRCAARKRGLAIVLERCEDGDGLRVCCGRSLESAGGRKRQYRASLSRHSTIR